MPRAARLIVPCLGALFGLGCSPEAAHEAPPPARAPRAVRLMRDDFGSYKSGADGSPVWTVDSGRWSVTDEGYRGIDCDGHFTAIGARSGRAEWTDYTVSLELRVASRGSDWRDGPWIGFRHRDRANAYTLAFHNRETVVHKVSGGVSTDDSNPLARSATTVTDGRWHRVEVAVVGARIAVRLDGEQVMAVTDEDPNASPPVPSGGIVLAARKHEGSTGSTEVVFRDVRVESAGGAPPGVPYSLADAKAEADARRRKVGMLDFMKSRLDRRYTDLPHKVLAFYYTWYGRPERHGRWVHWDAVDTERHDIASSTNYPALGAYDSHDPEVIDRHIDLARRAGIDTFICTWWGPRTFDDRALVTVLDRAAEKGLEVSVYWEAAPGEGRARIDRAVTDLVYILEKYGSHPAFLRVDGKPVIFCYGRLMGQVRPDEWPEIVTLARERAGRDFLLIADGYRTDFAVLLDGLHCYNICTWVRGKTPPQLAIAARETFARSVAAAKERARVSCITIIPGYDDTKIRTPGIKADRQGGATYRTLWEEAIRADPDWVLITSFNEWHEGSEIEPSREDGERYIDITGEYARRFKARPTSLAPVGGPSAGPGPERARALAEAFAGARVGLLPGFGGTAPLWLVEAGVGVEELEWSDLLDPERFGPERFPVVVYAGEESYVQTVDDPGDVDRALLRYLRAGGLLVALPVGPFPFYYNEEHEPVVSSGRFGLPVCGRGDFGRAGVDPASVPAGWEAPPEGAALEFRIDTRALPGLARAVPFPEGGDLRWRPCAGAVLPEGDVYMPLARLVDREGHEYGDGIAYVEHRASPPVGGKAIYAWMRMADVLGEDEFLFAVFRLAAARMNRPE